MAERHRLDLFFLAAGLLVVGSALAVLVTDLGGRRLNGTVVLAVVLVVAGVLGLVSAVLSGVQRASRE